MKPRAVIGLSAAIIIGFYLFLAIDTARKKSVHFDETAHIMSGYFMLKYDDYRLSTANMILGQKLAALPLLSSDIRPPAPETIRRTLDRKHLSGVESFTLGMAFLNNSGNDSHNILLRGRLMMILCGLATALLVFFWSKKLFGAGGGLISLCFLASCPVFISLSGIIGADIAATALLVILVWSYWTLLHRVTPLTVLIFGISAGLLLITKLSSLVFGPVALILLLIRLAADRPLKVGWNSANAREVISRKNSLAVLAGGISIAAVIVFITIWAAYGFRYSSTPPTATGATPDLQNLMGRQPVLVFAKDHHLLPEAFLLDYASLGGLVESRPSFLLGETSRNGRMIYFPFTFIAKTGLPMLLALILAVGACLWTWGTSKGGDGKIIPWKLYDCLPILTFVGVYMSIMITSEINIGHRHILPIYPFIYILLGGLVFIFNLKAVWPKIAMGFLLAAGFTAAISNHPNHLSYISPVLGGPSGGYKMLVDSSLEWGQELPALKKWMDVNQKELSSQTVYFSYFGSGSPEAEGIITSRLPGFLDPIMIVPQACTYRGRLKPGAYLLSATMLQPLYYSRFKIDYSEMKFIGWWSKAYEDDYQELRRNAEAFYGISENAGSAGNPSLLQDWMKKNCPAAAANQEDQYWMGTLVIYDLYRFARLASYLRHRKPDDHVNYSIYVFFLDEKELKLALEGDFERLTQH